ncbi:hypothetical protein [Leifsonia sp. SIMBA_070]|uniref:hypothetical protein n=1 Tax=Leifsonia sp. SIMBA_070 TaxID=3085810 RepID=UPI00397DBDF5
MTLDESIPIGHRRSPLPIRTVGIRPRALPDELAAVLHAAHQEEQEAIGGQRRAAYLLTRQVIAGLLKAGYPAAVLARELGVRPESVRTRGQSGWIALAEIGALCGLSDSELLEQCARNAIPLDEEGRLHSDGLVPLLLAER